MNSSPSGADDAAALARVHHLALTLADRACIADIESEGFPERDAEGRLWHDVRPLLDDREHAQVFVDMAREALDYAQLRGLVEVHPKAAGLVRILRRP